MLIHCNAPTGRGQITFMGVLNGGGGVYEGFWPSARGGGVSSTPDRAIRLFEKEPWIFLGVDKKGKEYWNAKEINHERNVWLQQFFQESVNIFVYIKLTIIQRYICFNKRTVIITSQNNKISKLATQLSSQPLHLRASNLAIKLLTHRIKITESIQFVFSGVSVCTH